MFDFFDSCFSFTLFFIEYFNSGWEHLVYHLKSSWSVKPLSSICIHLSKLLRCRCWALTDVWKSRRNPALGSSTPFKVERSDSMTSAVFLSPMKIEDMTVHGPRDVTFSLSIHRSRALSWRLCRALVGLKFHFFRRRQPRIPHRVEWIEIDLQRQQRMNWTIWLHRVSERVEGKQLSDYASGCPLSLNHLCKWADRRAILLLSLLFVFIFFLGFFASIVVLLVGARPKNM